MACEGPTGGPLPPPSLKPGSKACVPGGPQGPCLLTRGLPLVLGRAPPPVLMSRGLAARSQAARACREGWAAESKPRSCRPRGGGAGGLPRRTRRLQCRVQETIQLNRPEPSDCAASVGGTLLTHQHPGRKGALGARPALDPRPPPCRTLNRADEGLGARLTLIHSELKPPVSPMACSTAARSRPGLVRAACTHSEQRSRDLGPRPSGQRDLGH